MAASAAGFDEIPVVDLADINGSAAGRAALADRICRVCHEVGFMVVSGHGVDRGVVTDQRLRELFRANLAKYRREGQRILAGDMVSKKKRRG